MTYFDLFEIPVRFVTDKIQLSKRYFELSRLFHPDYFIGQGEAAEAEALEKSALLNKAYKTLQSRDATLKYILELKGLLSEEEKYQLPAPFLASMMEINEALMEAKMEGEPDALESIRQLINQAEQEIYEPVRLVIEEEAADTAAPEAFLPVKEYYFKKKYLERLKEQLK